MSAQTRAVRAGVAVGLIATAACTGSSDDSDADEAGQAPSPVAQFDVVEVAPPDTAAVTETTISTRSTTTTTTTTTAPARSRVDVVGPVTFDADVAALETALDSFGAANGFDITYFGTRDLAFEVEARVAAGAPPDIVLWPSVNTPAEMGLDGDVVPVPSAVADAARASWPASLNDVYTEDGVQYAVPVSVDLKSLVWYSPDRFDEFGFAVPTTFTEFETIIEQAAESDVAPLCVGIESASATGWVYTDWVEDIVLRQHGGEVYDQWVDHEVLFSDERIVGSMQTVLDLWAPENVFAEGGTIEDTAFSDGAEALVEGDCLMHRQAGFYEIYFPDDVGVADGSAGSMDVFLLPSDVGAPAVVAGSGAAAMSDRPEVWAVLEHLSSAEFADNRVAAADGDLLNTYSLAAGHDGSLYNGLGRRVYTLLLEADTYRFDASDSMPPVISTDVFWAEGTRAVAGEVTAAEAAAIIDASWPT